MTASKDAQKDDKDDEKFNLDAVLAEIGSFGRYQIIMIVMFMFRDSFLTMCNLNYVFATTDTQYRCYIPECDGPESNFTEPWTTLAMPNHTNKCNRYSPVLNSFLDLRNHSTSNNTRAYSQLESCNPDAFDREHLVRCERWMYADKNTFVAELDLGCDKWKTNMVGSVHNIGLFISAIGTGYISDRFGRKCVVVGTPLVVCVFGLLKSFAWNYWLYLALEFFESALGYGNSVMVLALESVSHNRRFIFSCLIDMFENIGVSLFALAAWKIQYWRTLLHVFYAPLSIVVLYIFYMDEGVRWLLANNRREKAVQNLNKIAKTNKVTLSKKSVSMLDAVIKTECDLADKKDKDEEYSILFALKSKVLVMRLSIISLGFLCCTFINTGMFMTIGSYPGSKYMNFALLNLATAFTRIIIILLLKKLGRKTVIIASLLACGPLFILTSFVGAGTGWPRTAIFILCKMMTSMSFFTQIVYAMEVFPTRYRNVMLNIAFTIGRIGSTLGPQTPLLTTIFSSLPTITFAVAALINAFIFMLLPNTKDTTLPDYVRQAEKIQDDSECIQDNLDLENNFVIKRESVVSHNKDSVFDEKLNTISFPIRRKNDTLNDSCISDVNDDYKVNKNYIKNLNIFKIKGKIDCKQIPVPHQNYQINNQYVLDKIDNTDNNNKNLYCNDSNTLKTARKQLNGSNDISNEICYDNKGFVKYEGMKHNHEKE